MGPDANHAYDDFTRLMHHSVSLRRLAVASCLAGVIDATRTSAIREASVALEKLSDDLDVDIDYERREFEKDLAYLDGGTSALRAIQQDSLPHFDEDVASLTDHLQPIDDCCFITDRDGTVNNYCARYITSVQSVYNAVFLTEYARARTARAILLTSAPLEPDGILDVTTMPLEDYLVAGSKGREFRGRDGVRHAQPIPRQTQEVLALVNERIAALLEEDRFRLFSRVGSGFQRKHGESTVGYNTTGATVPRDLAEAFRQRVSTIVAEADPEGGLLTVDDTGYDLEVIATAPQGAEIAAFTKADGLRFVSETASIDLGARAAVVCGDTASDLPMMELVAEAAPECRAVLVSRDDDLIADARARVSNLAVVATPDALVTALHRLGRVR